MRSGALARGEGGALIAMAYKRKTIDVFDIQGIDPRQDFHTLSTEQIERILAEADRVRYRKPKNANGSRARYFYALIQRRAGK